MLSQQLPEWLRLAAEARCRLPVVLSGVKSELWPEVQQLLNQYQPEILCWVGPDAPLGARVPSRQHKQLGTECDWLVINAELGFPADLVAAVSGSVKAGGLWLLLIPEQEQWITQSNPAHRHVLPYPLDAEQHQGKFIRFFSQRLQQCSLAWLTTKAVRQSPEFPNTTKINSPARPFATDEQKSVVAAIIKVATGHRKRPLVVTAHRGRGKSAALGLAAAQLATINKQIVLTAPNEAAAAICQQHFRGNCNLDQQQQLRYLPIDVLLQQKPTADIVLVDEAAAIPAPLLQQLVQQYPRVVFATTEHGYEGTGRGFQLRFQGYLQQHFAGYKQLKLQQPIRYAEGDPLEQLLFHSLLLNLNHSDPETTISKDKFVVKRYKSDQLCQQPDKLAEIFHLLSLAHYQTKVDDLAALLDNPQLEVVTLEQNDQLLACALLSYEGELSTELSSTILLGKRRVQGHLLAQSLAFHLAQPQLSQLAMVRVQRIVVQPKLQRQGLASELLQQIIANCQHQSQLLGTSFAASLPVLQFWQASGFVAVRLGIKADKASGEHSLLMLYPSGQQKSTIDELALTFASHLYTQVSALFSKLEPALLQRLVVPTKRTLSKQDYQALILFADQQRPFELVYSQLLYWLNRNLNKLADDDAELLIALFWLQLSWQEIAYRFQLTGKKQIISRIQNIIATSLATLRSV